jgi:NTP pyrophosphatase (non-canonical NTP hydrolase)
MKRRIHGTKSASARQLTLAELLTFIQLENRRLQQTYKTGRDFEKSVLGRTVKISEEVGELCNEVLAFLSLQRKEKMEHHESKLEEEIADVLITTLLLAERMGVDVEKALTEKIKKIHERYKKR